MGPRRKARENFRFLMVFRQDPVTDLSSPYREGGGVGARLGSWSFGEHPVRFPRIWESSKLTQKAFEGIRGHPTIIKGEIGHPKGIQRASGHYLRENTIVNYIGKNYHRMSLTVDNSTIIQSRHNAVYL